MVEQIREILISNGSQAKSFEYFSEQSRKLVFGSLQSSTARTSIGFETLSQALTPIRCI
jgi:hypothetical protein